MVRWASKTGIDWPTYKLIFKDTVAPAIGLAANQARPWSNVFGTIGFIVPMASIISHPSPPRAEFLWTLVTNILGACVSAAVTALALFCVIKAREQSESPITDPKKVPYNAVASTVAAIWLIVQIYITSAIRYKYPWTIWMTSACLIFSNYAMVYAVQFPDMTAAFRFLRQLLFVHLVGFGISLGVSLIIFPTNSRQRFYKTVSSCTGEIRASLRANMEWMEYTVGSADSSVSPELEASRKQHMANLQALQAELVVRVKDAQNEVVWDTLTPADLRTLKHLLEEIVIPLIGLCRVPDVLELALREYDGDEKEQLGSFQQYRELLRSVIDPWSHACAAIDASLCYGEAASGLGTSFRSVKDAGQDKEADLQQLQREMELLVESKTDLLNAWSNQYGSPDSESTTDISLRNTASSEESDQGRGPLHMLLYTELLLWSICHRVQELLVWTEERKSSQTSEKRRLVLPEWTSPKGLASLLRRWRAQMSSMPSNRPGAHQRARKHRQNPPRTPWTLMLQVLQRCTQFFASPASGFALRVSFATMSIAIVAYLPSTQDFYIKQHLVWAQYAVSFGMQGSAGQSVRALAYRVGGTIVAVCLAWVSWYIVVGIPAGVLVFYWLSMHFPMYIMTLRARYYTVGTVSAFAITTIIGNALQPNGSRQPTIILGAVRLAAIGGGCLLATIWTLFPFPASDHDGAKRSLGACLASLAEYHSGLQETVRIRLEEGFKQESPSLKSQDLEEMHSQLLAKCYSHLQALNTQLRVAKWNILTDGASFSLPHYKRACEKIDSLLRNLQLITFATRVFIDFTHTQPDTMTKDSSHWLPEFRNFFNAGQHEGLGVASLLGLLSHSIRNNTALPPHLTAPRPEKRRNHFDKADNGAVHEVMRLKDPGAATSALMRIGTKEFYRDLGELLQVVREMVGEFDFVCGFAIDEEE